MQIEIEKLKLEISICYEKLSRKDAENRKLIIQLEELKEWRIKFEEIKKQHAVEISRIRVEYEKKLANLQYEFDRLKKEHSVCPKTINDLEKEILRLEKIIEELRKRPQSSSSSSYREDVSEEEKLEIVKVVQVKTDDTQFEVIEEKKESKSKK